MKKCDIVVQYDNNRHDFGRILYETKIAFHCDEDR